MIISETVTPAGLRKRAEIMREMSDESCARHLELAADEIERLRAIAADRMELFRQAASNVEELEKHLEVLGFKPGDVGTSGVKS